MPSYLVGRNNAPACAPEIPTCSVGEHRHFISMWPVSLSKMKSFFTFFSLWVGLDPIRRQLLPWSGIQRYPSVGQQGLASNGGRSLSGGRRTSLHTRVNSWTGLGQRDIQVTSNTRMKYFVPLFQEWDAFKTVHRHQKFLHFYQWSRCNNCHGYVRTYWLSAFHTYDYVNYRF